MPYTEGKATKSKTELKVRLLSCVYTNVKRLIK